MVIGEGCQHLRRRPWLAGLGRSLGRPKGRQLMGIVLVLAVNVALGIFPLPLLLLAGQ